MEMLKRNLKKGMEVPLFLLGILLIGLAVLPYLMLGEGAVFTYHDQLDGEMIAYLLQAKHLGKGSILPEFLGGTWKTALMPPAPFFVLWFCMMTPFHALLCMQVLGWLFAFAGMFLLVHKATGKAIPAFLCGILYAFVPFLPVYGLSQYGLPLLLWCTWNLSENKKKAISLLYGLIYGLHSSLVLVGFAVLLVLLCRVLWKWIRERTGRTGKMERTGKNLLFLFGELVLVYLLTNLTLVLQVLGIGSGSAGLSHKAEYSLVPENFLQGVVRAFLHGGQHSEDYHITFLVFLGLVLVLWPVWNQTQRAFCKKIGGCLLTIAAFCAVAALWNSAAGMGLRSHIGALGAFQMDRLLWLAPCLWYLCLGYGLGILQLQFQRSFSGKERKGWWIFVIAALTAFLCLGANSFYLLKNSDVKSNIRKLQDPSYPAISYEEYYAAGVMDQIRFFLWEKTGRTQEDYRVVSLGIDPAAALMHGFYCLDGYSNNYPLEYKHKFRRIIAPALEQSDYLREYFDGWGNRCYLFGTECPGYYTIEKGGFIFSHLEIDSGALQEMGAEYLFSAAYIANAGDLGLELLRETPFETEESYYQIYVYQIK